MGSRCSCELVGGRWVRRRILSATVYLTPEQLDGLAELSHRARIPRSQLIRAGIELVLARVQEPARADPAKEGREP